MGAGCPCRDLSGVELVLCLSPPPSDYEVVLELPTRDRLVVNSEGFYLRRIVLDETLPFIVSKDVRLEPGKAMAAVSSMGLSVRELLCKAVKALLEAAENEVREAKVKARLCSGLIERILGRECQE